VKPRRVWTRRWPTIPPAVVDPLRRHVRDFTDVRRHRRSCRHWEWNTGTRKWTQLSPALSPRSEAGTGWSRIARERRFSTPGTTTVAAILLSPLLLPDAGHTRTRTRPMCGMGRCQQHWTNRTPTLPVSMPPRELPAMVFDEGRGKLPCSSPQAATTATLRLRRSAGDYWEWDPGAVHGHRR